MAKTYSYNFTLDDSSPYIKYEPQNEWFDNVAGDADLANYFQSSYHFTATRGASASLNFVGTGVTVVGSKYMTHDAIEVRIDNQIIRGFNAFSSTHQYRTFLAQVRGLRFGNHTIKVINRGSSSSSTSVLDIDAFVIETRGRGDVFGDNAATIASGNKTVDLPLLMFDDSKTQVGNNKITWSDGWEDDSTSLPNTGFLNGTVHETNKKGSTVTFDFYGEGIQVIGGIGPNNTQYTVQLDSDQLVTLNAKGSDFIPSSTLFYKTNLGGGAHKIVVTNTGAEGSALTIDAFQIFGGTNKTDFTGQVANNSDFTRQRNLGNAGMIVGIVVGVIAFILFLLIGLVVLAKHKGYDLPFAVPFLNKDEDNRRNRNGSNDNGSIGAAPAWGFGLNRSNTRGSNRTFVDPELGGIERTDANGNDKDGKKVGYGIGTMTEMASKWITGIRDLVVRNPDSNNPVTPALPVQRPVINIGAPQPGHSVSPGMVTVGLETGNANNGGAGANAARVWMDGDQRIQDQHRFSDQSLNDDWDHRRTRYGVGAPNNNNRGGNGGQGHSRNVSSPTDNTRNQYGRNPHRNSTGTNFSVSGYGGPGSPGATEYPETPARPRYEIEQREYPSSTTNNRSNNFGSRNGIGHGNTQAGGANRGPMGGGGWGFR
ncbi:hypothetical protein CPB86DRAFT_759419 [Serendipita vermifera]|nr:hypothetical protein CPB86DRAFT_759419 [Serendipita vermifera]